MVTRRCTGAERCVERSDATMDMYEMDMSDELLNMDSGDIWDTARLLETVSYKHVGGTDHMAPALRLNVLL